MAREDFGIEGGACGCKAGALQYLPPLSDPFVD
jgi:hypothetical protein